MFSSSNAIDDVARVGVIVSLLLSPRLRGSVPRRKVGFATIEPSQSSSVATASETFAGFDIKHVSCVVSDYAVAPKLGLG
jgi:hypothetical protein